MNEKITWLYAFAFAVIVASCEKSTVDGPSPDGLTECASCDFLYQEAARLVGWAVEPGNDRVFMFKDYGSVKNKDAGGPNYQGLYIAVPGEQTSFVYHNNDIKNDKVAYVAVCINCGMIFMEAVDGRITGKRVDANRWLVEAEVFLASTSPNIEVRDTLAFKQYFTPVSAH